MPGASVRPFKIPAKMIGRTLSQKEANRSAQDDGLTMALTYIDRGAAKSGTQFTVLAGTVRIASVTKTMQSIISKNDDRWDWHMYQPYGPPGYEQHGRANSLLEASAEVERMWSMWLQAAGLTESK